MIDDERYVHVFGDNDALQEWLKIVSAARFHWNKSGIKRIKT